VAVWVVDMKHLEAWTTVTKSLINKSERNVIQRERDTTQRDKKRGNESGWRNKGGER
jgi:hypothetical protein